MPHGKRKHELQCHSRSNGDITDNRQGPKAWVNLHEPLPAGNPESFNVHCVATNQRNGASDAPRPGCCVQYNIGSVVRTPFRCLRRIRGCSAPLMPPTISLSLHKRAILQTTCLPRWERVSSNDDDNRKKMGFLALHLIFRPGRALASRRLAIPSLLSLVYSSPRAQVRAALVAMLG